MKLEKLETYIDSTIVERGRSYFTNNWVEELEETEPDFWQAWVEGTDEYEVEVELSGGEVSDWSCTCPYDHGPVCKHVAATLMAIREQKTNDAKSPGSKEKKPSKSAQLNQVLAKLSRDDMEAYIRESMTGDRQALDSFLLRFQHLTGSSESLSKRCASLFDQIIRNHSDRGFIDYQAAFGFSNEVSKLLVKVAGDNIPPDERIACCLSILGGMRRDVVNSIDDSAGTTGELVEEISEIMDDAYPELTVKQQHESFSELVQLYYGGLEEYGLDSLFGVLNAWADAHAELQIIFLEVFDQHITQKATAWGREFALRQKFGLLKSWDRMDEAVLLAKQHPDISEFRKYFVEQAIESGDIAEAKCLIHEGITVAEQKGHSGTVTQWRELLLDMAEQENDVPAMRNELRLLMENSGFRLEPYRRYKAAYPADEWETMRHELYEQIKAQGTHADTLAAILDEENELEALFALIRGQKHGSIRLFKNYVKRLSAEFPEETAVTYAKAIRFEMKQTGRNVYEQAARDMKALAALPAGKEQMQVLLTEFCQQYKNRKAMLEIFRRVFG